MRHLTRQVKKIGNGAYITLPKHTIGHTVTVILEKTLQEIKAEALQLLSPYLKHIKGIYLHGSHARGDSTPTSDIDLLVISDGKVKIPRRMGEYEIMTVTLQGLEKDLSYLAPLVLPAIKEAKPILNEELLKPYKDSKLNKRNVKWYIETTQSAVRLAASSLEVDEDHTIPVYSLILRLRGLMMIDCMLNTKRYTTKVVSDYLLKRGLSESQIKALNNIYQDRRDERPIKKASVQKQSVIMLLEAVQEYYVRVREQWEKLD